MSFDIRHPRTPAGQSIQTLNFELCALRQVIRRLPRRIALRDPPDEMEMGPHPYKPTMSGQLDALIELAIRMRNFVHALTQPEHR